MRNFFFILLSSLFFFTSAGASDLNSELIFDPARIDHGHVHASCVIEYPNGDLLTVWYENGPHRDEYYYTLDADKNDNVRIGASHLRKGSKQWSEPFVISDTYGVSDNNPCLAVDKQNRLWLFHTAMVGAPIETWGSGLLCFKNSTDYIDREQPRWDQEGILIVHPNRLDETVAHVANVLRRGADRNNPNEAIATELLERLNDPFARRLGWMPRAHPLIRDDGALLLPLANENFNVPGMAITKDGGKTWTFSDVVPGAGVIQPSVVQFPDGKLSAFFRDSIDDKRIKRSDSFDKGLTWTPIRKTTLPNPGSGIEALILQSGLLAMVYNDKEESPRDRLAISLSDDEGKTWKYTRHIENSPGGRFDYPSIIQTQDGQIHITYSYNLETIKHVHFNENWIKG